MNTSLASSANRFRLNTMKGMRQEGEMQSTKSEMLCNLIIMAEDAETFVSASSMLQTERALAGHTVKQQQRDGLSLCCCFRVSAAFPDKSGYRPHFCAEPVPACQLNLFSCCCLRCQPRLTDHQAPVLHGRSRCCPSRWL